MIEIRKRNVFFLTTLSALSTLAILFYIYEAQSLTILSPPLNESDGYFESILYEYLPLAATILVLIWIRLESLRNGEKKTSVENIFFIVLSSFMMVFVVFRAMDIAFMIVYAPLMTYEELAISHVWIHASYYGMFSLVLFVTSAIFFGLDGLKTLLTISVVPAFYALNADLIMISNKVPVLSILHPIYLLIIEFGRIETVVLGGLLNAVGFKTLVYTDIFPFRLITGGTIYSIDLPCIGWEGIAAYTIIFLNLVMVMERRNKRRIFWWVLGFAGTLVVNLLRLTLIFVGGAIWGVSVADLIHHNAGDVIFLLWILGFAYVVNRLKNFDFDFRIRKRHKQDYGDYQR